MEKCCCIHRKSMSSPGNKFDTRMGDNASLTEIPNTASTSRSTNGLQSLQRRCLNLGNAFCTSLSTSSRSPFAVCPPSIPVTLLIVLVLIIILFYTNIGESILGLITRLSQLLALIISAVAFVLEKTRSVSELAAQSFPGFAHLNCIFVDCTESNFLRDTKNEIREAASLVSSVPALHHYPHVLVQYSEHAQDLANDVRTASFNESLELAKVADILSQDLHCLAGEVSATGALAAATSRSIVSGYSVLVDKFKTKGKVDRNTRRALLDSVDVSLEKLEGRVNVTKLFVEAVLVNATAFRSDLSDTRYAADKSLKRFNKSLWRVFLSFVPILQTETKIKGDQLCRDLKVTKTGMGTLGEISHTLKDFSAFLSRFRQLIRNAQIRNHSTKEFSEKGFQESLIRDLELGLAEAVHGMKDWEATQKK